MSFQPRIFTFYSYKGGVGRSMALLNMAYYLHARGRHVLIVDLDLDAPGASGFLHRTDELQSNQGTGDVVDVLAAVVKSVKEAPAGSEPPLPALRLDAFLRSVDPKKYAAAVHPKAPRARLDVLAADQERNYTERLSALDLPSLNSDQIFQTSELLRGLLLQHSFAFQQPWQADGSLPEDTHYDYILVDSRTGLSEIGGLCVGPLSDRLVVLCGLNDQNINGTRHFLDTVGLEPHPRPADAEPWDDADPSAESGLRPTTLGPKPTLLVASPVPGGEMTYKKERMKVLQEKMGMPPMKLSYHPQMALMETIFVRGDHQDEYLALEYAALADRLMSMVGDTEHQLLASVGRPFKTARDKDEAKVEPPDIPRRLALSILASGQTNFGFPSRLVQSMEWSAEVQDQIRWVQIHLALTNSAAARVWLDWADALDTAENREAGDLSVFQDMEGKFRKAAALNPKSHTVLNHWGIALGEWARFKDGAEAETLWSQAAEKYQQALEIKPNDETALFNVACLAALQGKADEAIHALERWKEVNPEAAKSNLNKDTDFDQVRDHPKFKAFRDGLKD